MPANPISTESPPFTVNRLAQATGVSETGIRKQLATTPSTETAIINGRPTAAYRMAALPAPITARLMEQARRRGLPSAEDLATDTRKPYAPEIPMAKIAPQYLRKAHKLRAAFALTIGRMKEQGISKQELARLGLPDFQREFGYTLTPRGWIDILDRTVKRDNGFSQFERLELYVDERASARPVSRAIPSGEFEVLAEFIATAADPAALDKDETALLWHMASEQFDGCPVERRKPFKRALVNFLHGRVPGLAKSKKALDKQLRRYHRRWIEEGRKPHEPCYKGRPRGVELSETHQRGIIIWIADHCGGREAQGWRDYLQDKIPNLHPEQALLDCYSLHPDNKSYVPRKIRDAVKHDIRAMETIRRGGRQYDGTAHLELDDSKIAAGSCWCSDDCTPPLYSYLADGNGYRLLRGQLLMTVDQRSRRILSYVLIPEKSYDSIAIRNHITNCARTHGLPNTIIWERGIWRSAKILKGVQDADLVSADLGERGILSLGIKIKHRTRPQGKIIENIFGGIQNRMEGEPGYCGRNEQTEVFERFQKLKLAVERGAANPVGVLYSFDEWFERLGQIFAEYNAARQDGKLGHISPDEAYEKYQSPDDPRIKFDDRARYMLATHMRPVLVTDNGIRIQIGKRSFVYRNRQTGELKGRRVLARFNPENPEVLYVTDPKSENPFVVERVQPLDPINADPAQLAAEMHRMREHQAPIRALYHSLKAEFEPQFRRNIVSPQVAENQRVFTEGENAIEEARTENTQKRAKMHRRAAAAGLAISQPVRDVDRLTADMDRLKDVLVRRKTSETLLGGTEP